MNNQKLVRIVVWVVVAALVLGVAVSLTALFL